MMGDKVQKNMSGDIYQASRGLKIGGMTFRKGDTIN